MKKSILLATVIVMLASLLLPGLAFADGKSELSVSSLEFELGVIINIEVREAGATLAGYYMGVIDAEPTLDNYDWVTHADPIIRTTKFPGIYYLWLRDTQDRVYGPTKVEMPQEYYCYFEDENTEFPGCALSEYLPKNCNYSVEELNALVAENVSKAGIYTREGVVIGVTTYLSKLQEFGIRIPFFFYGYWTVREYGWYTNPDWGTVYDSKTQYDVIRGRTPAEHEAGTHCNGFVHYCFRLAALNLRNTGKMGETGNIGGIEGFGKNKVGTYEGMPGDILQSCTLHEMLIIDKYDDDMDGWSDGYIIAESNDDYGGQVYCKKPYNTYSRFCKVFDMTGVYENTATLAWRLKFWQNYHIPTDAWPDYLLSAVQRNTSYLLFYTDREGVRTERVPFGQQAGAAPEIRNTCALSAAWDRDLAGTAMECNAVIRAVYTYPGHPWEPVDIASNLPCALQSRLP